MEKQTFNLFIAIVLFATACGSEKQKADAYGNFETTEITVSSEAAGKLILFDVEEGQNIQKDELVALVDTTLLHLQKKQLLATLGTIGKKQQDPNPQIAVLESQKANLIRERDRIARLLAEKAATSKQLDDLEGQITVVERQIAAARKQAGTVNTGILGEREPVLAQIRVIEEQIRRSIVRNPVKGTIINKIAEPTELVGFGTPLYKIAPLDTMILRAYVSGAQLSSLIIGQRVQVQVDTEDGSMKTLQGDVTWISGKSEFTPKTIQTKEERVNLVYAFKVRIANDGSIKIGMPAEVFFK
jgi:HlyD family secretion protein